jgi:hypothetical protein
VESGFWGQTGQDLLTPTCSDFDPKRSSLGSTFAYRTLRKMQSDQSEFGQIVGLAPLRPVPFVKQETGRWRKMILRAGIKPNAGTQKQIFDR